MPLTAKRLKRLTAYRERLEKQQEQELAKVLATRQRRIEALMQSQGARQSALNERPGAGHVDTLLLDATQRYLVRMSREVEARESALRHSDTEVAAERDFLLDRSRDRKAMETLREHALEYDRNLAQRTEAQALDEAAITRWQNPTLEGDVR
jgi:flagellar export protein FliJ